MAHPGHTPPLALLEEAVTVLFCQIDDAYHRLNLRGDRYASKSSLTRRSSPWRSSNRAQGHRESEHSFLREASHVSLTEELVNEAGLGGGEVARRLLGDLAYRSERLEEELAEAGIALVTSEVSARRPGVRQQVEICFSSLKRVFGLGRPWPRAWWVGHQDRGEDSSLHLRLSDQPGVGTSSREDQGVMGLNLITLIQGLVPGKL